MTLREEQSENIEMLPVLHVEVLRAYICNPLYRGLRLTEHIPQQQDHSDCVLCDAEVEFEQRVLGLLRLA
jgi:hypothetical protein